MREKEPFARFTTGLRAACVSDPCCHRCREGLDRARPEMSSRPRARPYPIWLSRHNWALSLLCLCLQLSQHLALRSSQPEDASGLRASCSR